MGEEIRSLCLGVLAASMAWPLAGCSTRPLPRAVAPMYCSQFARQTASVLLVGDAGAATLGGADTTLGGADTTDGAFADPVLRAVRADVDEQIARVGRDRTAVVYLGDNVYPAGLVPEGHRDRAHGEAVLNEQIRASGDAVLFFTLGNHDWNESDPVGPRGRDRALLEGHYLQGHAVGARLLPPAGCAGPRVVEFGQNLRFVFIDLMGWLLAIGHPDQVPASCRHRESERIEAALREVYRADGRTEILLMHHPLVTAGPHGGNFTWKQHVFPLTDFWPHAWIPLPGVGSLYPLSRQWGVTNTDLSNKDYQRLVEKLIAAQTFHSPAILAAGHEHSLQIHRNQQDRIQVVSGAGSVSKVDRVEAMDSLLMAIAAPGYVRLDEYDDRSLRLTMVALQDDDRPREIFQTCTTPR